MHASSPFSAGVWNRDCGREVCEARCFLFLQLPSPLSVPSQDSCLGLSEAVSPILWVSGYTSASCLTVILVGTARELGKEHEGGEGSWHEPHGTPKFHDSLIHSFIPSLTHLAPGKVLGAGVATLDQANVTYLHEPVILRILIQNIPVVATSQAQGAWVP